MQLKYILNKYELVQNEKSKAKELLNYVGETVGRHYTLIIKRTKAKEIWYSVLEIAIWLRL